MPEPRSTLLFVHASADLYGSDITLLQLVRRLDPRRFRCVVLVPYDGPLVGRLRAAGAETIVYPNLPVVRRKFMNPKGVLLLAALSLRAARRIAAIVRDRDVALVHSNTLAVVLAGPAVWLTRRPHVCHVHEIPTRPRPLAAFLAMLSSATSTLVVANSRTTAEHYRQIRHLFKTPVEVVMNGVDETRLRDHTVQDPRSLAGAGPGDVVFTLVGRVNSWKGHWVFLDAAERLAAEQEGVRFLMAGDSFAGQEHLSKAVDRRIESSSVLRGRATRVPHVAEVGGVYAASDVVVVPSTEPEPFGLVAAEAMAMGLPVVASRIGALPEVVEHGRTGLLVEPGDAISLARAMGELGRSPARRAEMGEAGRERFGRCFRVERYVDEFGRLYERLLGEE